MALGDVDHNTSTGPCGHPLAGLRLTMVEPKQREIFEEMVADGAFVEWAEVHGNLYGTAVAEIERIRKQRLEAIAQEMVKLHHGEIEVSSEVGVGTTFRIFLPVGDEHLMEEEKGRRGEEEKRRKGMVKLGFIVNGKMTIYWYSSSLKPTFQLLHYIELT